MTYYGQHDPPVDKIIEELLPEGFVGYAADVGAANGIVDSNTYLFEQRGWKVLCVEPNPSYLGELSKNRKMAVGELLAGLNLMLDFSQNTRTTSEITGGSTSAFAL